LEIRVHTSIRTVTRWTAYLASSKRVEDAITRVGVVGRDEKPRGEQGAFSLVVAFYPNLLLAWRVWHLPPSIMRGEHAGPGYEEGE
jgi:hypothetical protein